MNTTGDTGDAGSRCNREATLTRRTPLNAAPQYEAKTEKPKIQIPVSRKTKSNANLQYFSANVRITLKWTQNNDGAAVQLLTDFLHQLEEIQDDAERIRWETQEQVSRRKFKFRFRDVAVSQYDANDNPLAPITAIETQ